MFKIHEIPMKEQFSENESTINQKLQGFQHMYQQYASGLLDYEILQLFLRDIRLYTKQNSVETLKAENDKLLKENLELKKKLEKKSDSENQIKFYNMKDCKNPLLISKSRIVCGKNSC